MNRTSKRNRNIAKRNKADGQTSSSFTIPTRVFNRQRIYEERTHVIPMTHQPRLSHKPKVGGKA